MRAARFIMRLPDNGIFSQVEQIEQAARIAAAMNIPLIADADTLGETTADAFHLTRRYVRAGIAGFHIEDENNPKHSTWSQRPHTDRGYAGAHRCLQAGVRWIGIRHHRTLRRNVSGLPARRRRWLDRGGKTPRSCLCGSRCGCARVPDRLARGSPRSWRVQCRFPVCTLGFNCPGTAFTLSTGWGWTGAAQLHLARARELMQTGTVKMDHILEGKDELHRAGCLRQADAGVGRERPAGQLR